MPDQSLHTLVKDAFERDDAPAIRAILQASPALKAMINQPVGPFDSPAIISVRSRAMLDVLLDAGADINARSRWWAGGFGILDHIPPELAGYAIQRGARVDAHAAARLGLLERLAELVAADPSLVNARAGDGQMPLHVAGSVEIAAWLLDHGAEIDARDIDHESTPAQYAVKSRPAVAGFLIRRGCAADLLMAAALGDVALVAHILDTDADAVRTRVSDEWFPMMGAPSSVMPGQRSGGTIYQWELGWYVSAHQVARNFGHGEVLRLLMERSPPEVRLVAACWMGDETLVDSLLKADPALAKHRHSADQRNLAHAARNNDLRAARLMLRAGLPNDRVTQHGATALHWAAYHGNAALVELLLATHPPLEARDNDFQGTPLGWAVHGSENAWDRHAGDYGATVERLIVAGAQRPAAAGGSPAVRAALQM